jgi:hypothetical protein
LFSGFQESRNWTRILPKLKLLVKCLLAAKKQLDMSHPFFNVPERTGDVDGWNFEKALRFLHKDKEILLF